MDIILKKIILEKKNNDFWNINIIYNKIKN